ncbi:MAG: DEAD/DEAH box helicase [bacterium]
MPFSKLGLSDQLVQGILATGYTAPTAIQSRAIPLSVAGKDIIGCARTGTGKTAAFVLPMLDRFIKHHITRLHVRGLVLTPTRELAQQVEEFVTQYGRFTSIRCLAVYGGVNMENQVKRLRRGIDIVVATPGRLIDHMNRGSISLSQVEFLVIDEADRMFDMGFITDVRKIIAQIPAKRQTLLFSATISTQVKELVSSVQKHPELIEIGEQRKPVDSVRQHFYAIPHELKLSLLVHIINKQEMDSVLVFSRTKHGADKITRRLEKSNLKAIAIHSNRTQAQRQQALAGFKQGRYRILVATDIAARGIDVEGISHVINYDTPTFAEDYIHRIGRTGRAEATGDAITFVSHQEREYIKRIERFIGKRFDVKEYHGFDYSKSPAPAPEHKQPEKAETHKEQRPHRQERRHEGSRHEHRGPLRQKDHGVDKHKHEHTKQPHRSKSDSQAKRSDWQQLVVEIEKEKDNRKGFKKKITQLIKKNSLLHLFF